MKKYLLMIPCLLACATFYNAAYASDKYQQTIKLNVQGNEKNSICFKTTDVFDGKHCGSSASNSYDKGPKNYYLTLSGGQIKYDDTSCQKYFEKNNPQRTPESNGTLTIYLNSNSSAGYIGVSNCTPIFNAS